MHGFILWCGFLGAWLLVAGPVYQAALELREEGFERAHLEVAAERVDQPRDVSAWWWLVPPVHYLMSRRRSNAYRRAVFGALTTEQKAAMVSFMNKATGWLFVALGGSLIATKETYELVEYNEWPDVVFWVLVVVMAALALFNTAARMSRTRRIIEPKRD